MTVWARQERLDETVTISTTPNVADAETVATDRNTLERVLAEAGYLPGENTDAPRRAVT